MASDADLTVTDIIHGVEFRWSVVVMRCDTDAHGTDSFTGLVRTPAAKFARAFQAF
jgi:hypothetical protein